MAPRIIDLTDVEDSPGTKVVDLAGVEDGPSLRDRAEALFRDPISSIPVTGLPMAALRQLGISEDTGRAAASALGAAIPAAFAPQTFGTSAALIPAGATAGGQAWDLFTRLVKGETKAPGDVALDSAKEFGENAAFDLATLGLGRLGKGALKTINKNFGATANNIRKAQSAESLPAMLGQGIQQTNASEGGAKQLAKQVDSLIESNAFYGKEFDPISGKFVGDVGKETLEQTRDRLGKDTLSKIAEARKSFLSNLDTAAKKSNAVPISKAHLDYSVPNEILARLEQSGENKELVKELDGLVEGFTKDIGDSSSFEKAQELLRNQYDKIKALKAYDGAMQVEQDASKKAANAYERDIRISLAESLRKTIQERADEVGDILGVRAPDGGVNSEYLDKLNNAYGAVATISEDLDSFIRRQIGGGTGQRPGQSFVQTDVSKLDPRSPIQSSWRAALGGPLERFRQNQIFNNLDNEIPKQLRAFFDIRQGKIPTIPDGSSIIDPFTTFADAGMAALVSERESSLPRDVQISEREVMDKMLKHLQPEEAQAMMQRVQEASRSGDEVVKKKAYGAMLATIPELREEFEPGKTIAASEFDGIIADPNEKRALKMKLSSAVRSGNESTIEAAKFVSSLNADRKFKTVPKSVRQPKERVYNLYNNLGPFEPSLQPVDPISDLGQQYPSNIVEGNIQ